MRQGARPDGAGLLAARASCFNEPLTSAAAIAPLLSKSRHHVSALTTPMLFAIALKSAELTDSPWFNAVLRTTGCCFAESASTVHGTRDSVPPSARGSVAWSEGPS